MAFASNDVVPFTVARANLSELAEQAKAGAEKIITKNGQSYVALIDAGRLDDESGHWSEILTLPWIRPNCETDKCDCAGMLARLSDRWPWWSCGLAPWRNPNFGS